MEVSSEPTEEEMAAKAANRARRQRENRRLHSGVRGLLATASHCVPPPATAAHRRPLPTTAKPPSLRSHGAGLQAPPCEGAGGGECLLPLMFPDPWPALHTPCEGWQKCVFKLGCPCALCPSPDMLLHHPLQVATVPRGSDFADIAKAARQAAMEEVAEEPTVVAAAALHAMPALDNLFRNKPHSTYTVHSDHPNEL